MKYIIKDDYRDETETFDNYDDAVEWCYEQEIIYYSTAMNYLFENDASLTQSTELAYEMGLEAKGINSELLATLLYQSNLVNSITEEQ